MTQRVNERRPGALLLRWVALVCVASTVGCATQPPRCQRLDTDENWQRLSSPPDFVVAETYDKMFPHGVPDKPEKFAWYSQSPDRFAACLPGDRFGCGDFVFYFSGHRLDDLSEMTLCGESSSFRMPARRSAWNEQLRAESKLP